MDAEGGPANSASLKACEALLQEYLPKLKALPAVEVRRVVCGGCGDFKVVVTQPCAEHDAWKASDYTIEGTQHPSLAFHSVPLAKLRCGPLLTGEFMEKLKAIGAPHLRGRMSSRAPAIATLHLSPDKLSSLVRRGHEPSRGAGVHVRDALRQTIRVRVAALPERLSVCAETPISPALAPAAMSCAVCNSLVNIFHRTTLLVYHLRKFARLQ